MIKSVIMITGLRPMLSETFPRMGLKRNWIKEYIATIKPILKSEIPKSLLANVGRIGINIPNPIKSMNTVIKITDNDALDLFKNYLVSSLN